MSDAANKSRITWSDPSAKTQHAIKTLGAILPPPGIPRQVTTADAPAASLLHDPDVAAGVSALLRRPESGVVNDPLCAWLYDTFNSAEPELHLIVLSFLPTLAGVYLSRAGLNKPLPGFESVFLAVYGHETASRSGQAVSVTIPDLAHHSGYHDGAAALKSPKLMASASSSSSATGDLQLGFISPVLEPYKNFRSTRRARIVGVGLELYYTKISQIPIGSKIEFCEFCQIWSGQDDGEANSQSEKIHGKKGRINLPWELLQPILRILGHCLMSPETNKELFRVAMAACRCLNARALHDINPKAILATGSLVKLADMVANAVDHTDIENNNVIKIN